MAVIRIEHADPVARQQAEARRARQLAWLAEQEKARGLVRDAEQARRQADEDHRSRCESARDELRFLREADGMRLMRPERPGQPESIDWLDADERAALVAAWNRQVQDWCFGRGGTEPVPPPVHAVPAPVRRHAPGR